MYAQRVWMDSDSREFRTEYCWMARQVEQIYNYEQVYKAVHSDFI